MGQTLRDAASVQARYRARIDDTFIHGLTRRGKTHLLHAIGHHASRNHPDPNVHYVSTETFAGRAHRGHPCTTATFRRHYRGCDLLLVADVQLLEGNDRTQDEFFHTFSSLDASGSQVVLTCDRPPRSIATLEDRCELSSNQVSSSEPAMHAVDTISIFMREHRPIFDQVAEVIDRIKTGNSPVVGGTTAVGSETLSLPPGG